MNRRNLLMKELGLTVWRMRGHFAPSEAADAKPAVTTMAGIAPPAAQQVPEQLQTVIDEVNDIELPADSQSLPRNWAALEQDIPACKRCILSETRTQTVFERGNRHAPLMIVGEAPGEQEDRLGQPFVGPAGKLLDAMLTAAGWNPAQDVYVANVLKCRPPGNRNPLQDEMAACVGFLSDQLRLVQPRLILCVGRIATQALLDTEQAISRLRGQIHYWQGVPLIVSYHPAYLLRNLPDKAKAWQDLCLARRTLAGLSCRPESRPAPA